MPVAQQVQVAHVPDKHILYMRANVMKARNSTDSSNTNVAFE